MTSPPDEKPRIALVGHLAGAYRGGAERSFLDIIAAVDRDRYHLTCVLPPGDEGYIEDVRRRVDDLVVFAYSWGSVPPGDGPAIAGFEAAFRRGRIDLVHVNTITLIAPLLAAARLGVPSIVHARELIDQDDELAGLLGETASRIALAIAAAAGFVIANSEATHRLYRKPGASLRLYNCVDLDAWDLPNNPSTDRLKVGIVSSNSPRKGIEDFARLAVAAGARGAALEFVMIGPRTAHADELACWVRGQSGPVNLRFEDYAADPVDAIGSVNVVASFSAVPESFGRTIAEGMAARRPVLSYATGAAPELIRHGQDGFLAPPGDVTAVLGHLEMLAACPGRVAELGRNGRARAVELFSPRRFAETLNGVYRRLLGG
jgi:glycosyltransferase involved in cell wall biosynthesis